MDPDDEQGEAGGQGAPLSYLGALGWTFGVSGLTALLALFAAGLRPGGSVDPGTELFATAAATLGLLFAMARVHAPEEDLGELLGLRRVSWPVLALSLVAGAALVLPLARLDAVVADRFPLDPETREYLATDTLKQRVVLSALITLGPLLGELYFRGAIFGLLARHRAVGMVVLATTVLTFFPPSARALFSGLVYAMAASHLRGRSASVIPALALRAGCALVGVVAILSRRDDDEVSARVALGGAAVGVVALGLALALARSARPAREVRE